MHGTTSLVLTIPTLRPPPPPPPGTSRLAPPLQNKPPPRLYLPRKHNVKDSVSSLTPPVTPPHSCAPETPRAYGPPDGITRNDSSVTSPSMPPGATSSEGKEEQYTWGAVDVKSGMMGRWIWVVDGVVVRRWKEVLDEIRRPRQRESRIPGEEEEERKGSGWHGTCTPLQQQPRFIARSGGSGGDADSGSRQPRGQGQQQQPRFSRGSGVVTAVGASTQPSQMGLFQSNNGRAAGKLWRRV